MLGQEDKKIEGNNFLGFYNSKVNKVIIKVSTKNSKEFICLESEDFESKIRKNSYVLKEYVVNRFENAFLFVELFFLTLAFIISWHVKFPVIPININVSVITISWLVINIILHEYAHILMLNFFCHTKEKIKFKFKLGIFPVFYVNTSDSYLLKTKPRIIIYLAGLAMNSFLNLFLLIFIILTNKHFFVPAYLTISYTIIFNLIPLMGTDGCNILLSFLNEYPFKKNKKNSLKMKVLNILNQLAKVALILLILFSIIK